MHSSVFEGLFDLHYQVDSHGYNDCGMPTIPTLNVPSAFRHSCEEDLVKAMSMDKDISGKYVWKFLVEVQNKVNQTQSV